MTRRNLQVDAGEHCPWRYMLLSSGLLAAVPWIQRALDPAARRGDPALLLLAVCFGLLLLVAICQPWHRHMRLDLGVQQCRLDWRLFGFLPVGRRTYRIAHKDLFTKLVRPVAVVEEAPGFDASGCLLVILPFPLNLIYGLARSKDELRTKTSVSQAKPYWVLELRDRDTGSSDVLLRLRDAAVAAPLLLALKP